MTHTHPEQLQLNDIDRQFAAFICRQAGSDDIFLCAAAALLSRGVVAGDVCLDLQAALEGGDASHYGITDVQGWVKRLRGHRVVGVPGDFAPLILDDTFRLYLHRYWRYEDELAAAILKRGRKAEFDRDVLKMGVARLFPPAVKGEVDWQRVAAISAVTRRFCVISGGPGTGKTSTVVKVLALLLEQQGGARCRIALAAPTGKAAARLKESIQGGASCAAEVASLIPEDVFTIHRLLGYLKGSCKFRHHRDNPLPYDLVIVDEASMVSLPLMAKLVDALRDDARLILLGDRDQLASVEAGAVLGDICDTGGAHSFSAKFSQLVADLSGEKLPAQGTASALGDAVVLLQKSYRFSASSGIGVLGARLNAGDAAGALAVLGDAAFADVGMAAVPPADALPRVLADKILAGYSDYLKETVPDAAFQQFGRFRILCALRSGPYGVENLNQLVEERLAAQGLIQPQGRWYAGQPIMITANDYNLGLFNGDVGLVLPDAGNGGELRAFFPSGAGMRAVLPLRLPEHENAYVMTVHKSQGSEFDRVLMVLPDRDAPILTRELLYTGVTRARKEVEIVAGEKVFADAAQRRIVRRSGLRDRLWGKRPAAPAPVKLKLKQEAFDFS